MNKISVFIALERKYTTFQPLVNPKLKEALQ